MLFTHKYDTDFTKVIIDLQLLFRYHYNIIINCNVR